MYCVNQYLEFMKPYICFLFTLSFIPGIFAQDDDNNLKNELRLDAGQLMKNTFLLIYERKINEKTSILLSGGAILKENNSEIKRGGLVEAQYRLNKTLFRKNKDSISNKIIVYAAPFIRYRYLDATNTDYIYYSNEIYYSGSIYPYYPKKRIYYFSTISGGTLIGIKFSFFKYIFIDMNFGGGIKFTQTNGHKADKIFDDAYTGVTPMGSLSFGFKF